MSDALNQCGVRFFADLADQFVPGAAVARSNPNLDEFVVVEGQFDLGQDRRL